MVKRRKRSNASSFPRRFSSEIIVWKNGDTTKPDPLFILVINNIALKRPGSNNFVADMATGSKPERDLFTKSAEYIKKNLYGEMPGQKERLLADSPHSSKIKFLSMYVWGAAPNDATSFVEADFLDRWITPRQNAVAQMLASVGMNPDIVFIVSNSLAATGASAFSAIDDDARGGISVTYDGTTLIHRFYHKTPGMVALHTTTRSMTAGHEFGHAFSFYGTSGRIVDLYTDGTGDAHFNRKVGRPIPDNFAVYQGITYLSDKTRNSLGYHNLVSYHSELADPEQPALMDRYWAATEPMSSRHDKMTKAYIMDRIAAKVSR